MEELYRDHVWNEFNEAYDCEPEFLLGRRRALLTLTIVTWFREVQSAEPCSCAMICAAARVCPLKEHGPAAQLLMLKN